MNRNQSSRIVKTFALVAILISMSFSWRLSQSKAQSAAPAEYDYYSLALTSISNSAREASKLPNIPERVNIWIQVVKLLPASQHDEAIRLLDLALVDLKQWASKDKAGWYQRHTAATFRNDVLALYARWEPEKAMAVQKELQAEAKSIASKAGATSLKADASFTQFSNRRTTSDQAAKIALSLIDRDPEKALMLVVQSLQEGTVSGVLSEIVQKLLQNGNRTFLSKLEIAMGQVMAVNATLDPSSLAFGSSLIQRDTNMPLAARSAVISFLMRSVQAQSNFILESSENGRMDPSYIRTVFTLAALNVRPVILRYSPDQGLMFEQLLDPVAQLVPAETRSRLQAFQPETFSEPRERLNDILKDQNPDKRDLRLVRLVSDLLRNKSDDFQKNLDLASDVINGFSDPEVKSAYSDLLTITRIDAFVKERKFIEAQALAGSISSEEARAWALLALSSVAAKSDSVLGFELISNALKALDKASPSPHKVELALGATAMLAKSDPQRAFDTLSTASKYANSSASRIDPPAKPAVGFGLEARIGDAHTKLGVYPESLAELEISPSLAVLGTTDWFRADQIVGDIREPALRLQLKLLLAGAVLAKGPKPNLKETAPKQPASRN